MALLGIDTTTGIWHQVLAYCAQRREELLEVCTSLTVSDQERRDAAARLAELSELLQAPAATKRMTENRREPRETY